MANEHIQGDAGGRPAPSSSGQPQDQSITRYLSNLRSEQEGVALYRMLADGERDAHLAEIYRRLAGVEQRHAQVWADYLLKAGVHAPAYTPSLRIRTLGWLARRLGAGAVVPIVSSMERDAVHTYDAQPEARA